MGSSIDEWLRYATCSTRQIDYPVSFITRKEARAARRARHGHMTSCPCRALAARLAAVSRRNGLRMLFRLDGWVAMEGWECGAEALHNWTLFVSMHRNERARVALVVVLVRHTGEEDMPKSEERTGLLMVMSLSLNNWPMACLKVRLLMAK
eukprot:1191080-Prorocentrum_minimum.AAC.2